MKPTRYFFTAAGLVAVVLTTQGLQRFIIAGREHPFCRLSV
jgi:hypothetical protein